MSRGRILFDMIIYGRLSHKDIIQNISKAFMIH